MSGRGPSRRLDSSICGSSKSPSRRWGGRGRGVVGVGGGECEGRRRPRPDAAGKRPVRSQRPRGAVRPPFGRRGSCPVSSLLAEELPGPAAESARSEPRTFFLFFFSPPKLDKVTGFSAAPGRVARVAPCLRCGLAAHGVCPRLAARVRASGLQVRPAGSPWARPSPNRFALSHPHAHKHRARGNPQPKCLAPSGAQCGDL